MSGWAPSLVLGVDALVSARARVWRGRGDTEGPRRARRPMGRAPCCDRTKGLKKGPWTPEEDKLLVDYIQANGHGSWRMLPKLAGQDLRFSNQSNLSSSGSSQFPFVFFRVLLFCA